MWLAAGSVGYAQDGAGDGPGETAGDRSDASSGGASLDLTMTLMPENAVSPGVVTSVIELPAPAAGERAATGPDQANEARETGDPGLEAAGQAGGPDGREFGEAIRELARDNLDNTELGEPPDTAPPPFDLPGPPDIPGPPQN